jgi:hypothetical protein
LSGELGLIHRRPSPPPFQFADDGVAFSLLCSVVKELSPGVYGLAKLAKPFEDLLYQLTRPLVNGASESVTAAAASALAALASDSHAKGREANTAMRKVTQVHQSEVKQHGAGGDHQPNPPRRP